MNQIYQIILTVIGSIASLGILSGGAGYLVNSFKKGEKKDKADVINTSQEVINFWKSQAENFQTILSSKEKDWNQKFSDMSKELGQIQGQLASEKAQTERLEKIFQNRNPEQETFMKAVMLSIENQGNVNVEIVKLLGDIHKLAVDEHNRETKVETVITKS